MQDELLKYRGLQPNGKMESRRMFYIWNMVAKDSRDSTLDPFMYKYALQPPKQGQ